MQQRRLGSTGLDVSVLGFGCGAIGGLLVRGSPRERLSAVAAALDHGVTYFDTAPFYGDGASEQHLGDALAEMRGRRPVVGTKVMLPMHAAGGPGLAVELRRSVHGSLRRLRCERIDLLQLHNGVAARHTTGTNPLTPDLSARVVIDEVVPALQALVDEGLVGHIGLSAMGDAQALCEVAQHARVGTAQVLHNLLDPSALGDTSVEPARPAYRHMTHTLIEAGTGLIAIRVMAGGALSVQVQRHALASPQVFPMGTGVGSGADYVHDLALGRRFDTLARQHGLADVTELALRYAISTPQAATALVGFSSLEQIDTAVRCIELGPLDAATLAAVIELQTSIQTSLRNIEP